MPPTASVAAASAAKAKAHGAASQAVTIGAVGVASASNGSDAGTWGNAVDTNPQLVQGALNPHCQAVAQGLTAMFDISMQN